MEPRMNLFENETGARIGKRIFAVSQVIQASTLAGSTQELVQLRASQINGCGFCIDIHGKDAAAAGESAARLNLVAAWRHSTVFSEAEQAALALTEEGTRIIDGYEGVSDETWARVRKHYDDDQTIALVSLIAMINATNRLGVILNNQGGAYTPGALAAVAD
ncbi:carboxymuconolactone decarboxylase family protein [Streptomyces sp. NPDC087901]|uniref:carboxymuconolactone decarboxylase family protein n=1 Tax=Streptomyces sp. NPDC087901 TaxID=3365818 RepID=UPI003816EE7E